MQFSVAAADHGLGEKRHRAIEVSRFIVFVGDLLAVLGGLAFTFVLRFEIIPQLTSYYALSNFADILYGSYLIRIAFGSILLIAIILSCGGYQSTALLRFRRSFPILIRALSFWALMFPAICLFAGVDRQISRLFIVLSVLILAVTVPLSRLFTLWLISRLGLSKSFRQRILFVDWTAKTAALAKAIKDDRVHPYELVGCAPAPTNRFSEQPPVEVPSVGCYSEIYTLCENGLVDILILADGQRDEKRVLKLAEECEKTLVKFMVIPSGFQVLVSGLGLTTVSSVPLLGITSLPLNRPTNAAKKRAMDIVGGFFGLIISSPVILALAILVRLESPGPIFYRQIRSGRGGRKFKIIKIRSMKLDAEKESGARWATVVDDRRLRIGTFMRRWNLDELPQFWNVIIGDLSLVGPRPERPELIQKFRHDIPFYNARHNIVPGMTGWAQVNGLRGDTDLSERIRYDIFYIENWSLILDIQIMFMTFFRWKGAY